MKKGTGMFLRSLEREVFACHLRMARIRNRKDAFPLFSHPSDEHSRRAAQGPGNEETPQGKNSFGATHADYSDSLLP
jgi:hypothetical protein